MNDPLLGELLPVVVDGIIGHVTIYQAQVAYYAHCVKEGRITVHEEARLRDLARRRLERYLTRKLLQYAQVGRQDIRPALPPESCAF